MLLTHAYQRLVNLPIGSPKASRCREQDSAGSHAANLDINKSTKKINAASLASSNFSFANNSSAHLGSANVSATHATGSPSLFVRFPHRSDTAACEVRKVVSKPNVRADEIDPLFLFACFVEWEQGEEPGAAWELIAATESANHDNRANARALLGSSRHLSGIGAVPPAPGPVRQKSPCDGESEMKTPYGLDLAEDCTNCPHSRPGFFCAFSMPVLRSLNQVSHKSVLPAGAVLFVEGQTPRGMFILCSGRVNLSTTSREGKILILKTAEAGEVLGLSAAVSGMGYETTAETATPCQLNFVDRKHLLELMEGHSEVGVHTSQSLSRDFHYAYRDIHDLVLTRSSAGKLAKLLLSQSAASKPASGPSRVNSSMTHEEMAQRIGSSRETVTRLLSDLRRKRLIRLDGPGLVIHDRDALEKLAV